MEFSFRIYDREGNGYITTDVLKEILKEIDPGLTNDDLDNIIEEVDEDGSGTLDFDEAAPWSSVEEAAYDVAVALETVEHLAKGPQHFFQNAARALKPGGLLIVTTPNSNSFSVLARWLITAPTVGGA